MQRSAKLPIPVQFWSRGWVLQHPTPLESYMCGGY